ncbi:MAG: hypothetical protein ACYSSI_00965 [Planctomycetota bacterium]
MLWLFIVLVLVLVKANRNPRAWLIFIPLLIINLFWTVLKKIMPFPSSALAIFDQLFASITVGISVLWLLSHKISNRHGFITFLRALVIIAVLCIVGVISYSGLTFSKDTVGYVIIIAVLTLVMLLAFVLTSRRCRKRYSNLRFMLWLFVWTIVMCITFMLGVVVIMMILNDIPVTWISMLLQGSITGLVLGGCLYVIMFPFMILALRSSFFRERLCTCLHLKSMSKTISPVVEAGSPGEQKPGSEISEDSN